MTMSIISTVKMVLNLRCDESSRLHSEAMDRRLSPAERLALRLHLMICGKCRRFRRRLRFLAEALRRLASGTAPAAPSAAASLSADARHRIDEALRQG